MENENVVHTHRNVNGKKIEIMKFADKWVKLEDIILSEATKPRKPNPKREILKHIFTKPEVSHRIVIEDTNKWIKKFNIKR